MSLPLHEEWRGLTGLEWNDRKAARTVELKYATTSAIITRMRRSTWPSATIVG